ncbi:RNA polymerase, sigma 54 subunit, RpoN/SigL [Clostridium cavendishii DSM 21758]|uniref:RNA polymerase, sigma 54 subunit, RpoN/SigL n=2 Tax=Clostridium TaxID=1485 RepID=A0A1M6MND4_9CLOT|nr:RNA polymerase, sigma 54 subunit, RpoN/SigL [Clostridium cavendishii DSM 21758]
MNMNFNLNLTQEQKLIMTQQMQLSIKLLQMSSYDLREYIDKEFSENPVLEAQEGESQEEVKTQDRIDYKEFIKYLEFDNYGSQSYGDYNSDEDVSPFNFITNEKSLKEYLHEQVLEIDENEYIKVIADYIIENIDGRGYLDATVEGMSKEIKTEVKFIEEALELVQSLEPNGIGARDLKECLMIQLRNVGMLDEPLEFIIENHLEDIGDNRYQAIAKAMSITPQKAQEYGDVIKKLEPKPSRGYYTGEEVKFIVPDAYIRNIDGEYFIIMNEEVVPRLSINPIYKEILTNTKDENATEYVKDKLGSAMFLIKSIEQRKSTLHKVLEKILEKQKEYFEKGEKYLKPMTLKEIAEAIEMHESTVSRAIREKYVLTSRGTVKIKDLFTTGITKQSNSQAVEGEDVTVINIKKAIEKLVNDENKKKPLSDQIICDKLNEMDINISRRTVAKYREELGIKSSSKRKRF